MAQFDTEGFLQGFVQQQLSPQGFLGGTLNDQEQQRKTKLQLALESAKLEQELALKQKSEMIPQEQQQALQQYAQTGVIPPTGTITHPTAQKYFNELSQKRMAEQASFNKENTLITPEMVKTYPDLAKAGYQAGQTVPKQVLINYLRPANSQALTEEDINNGKELLKNGTPLSLLGGRGSQKIKIAGAYEKERQDNLKLGIKSPSINELEANYRAEQSRARTLNGPQTQKDLAGITQYNNAADAALQALEQVSPSRLIPFNKLTQEYINKVDAGGDKQSAIALANLKAALLEMSLQGGQVFTGNALTDVRFKQESERLNSAQNKEVTKAVIGTLRQIANSRREALINTPTLLPNGMQSPQSFNQGPLSGLNQQSQQPQNPSSPAINIDAVLNAARSHMNQRNGKQQPNR